MELYVHEKKIYRKYTKKEIDNQKENKRDEREKIEREK